MRLRNQCAPKVRINFYLSHPFLARVCDLTDSPHRIQGDERTEAGRNGRPPLPGYNLINILRRYSRYVIPQQIATITSDQSSEASRGLSVHCATAR